MAGKPRPCCNDDANLKEVERNDEHKTVVRQCSVCQAKHYEVYVDPLKMNIFKPKG